MPAANPSQLNFTQSTEAAFQLASGEVVSAFALRTYAARCEFEGRLCVAILPPNMQDAPVSQATINLVKQRLYEVMNYVAVGELRVLDWRGGIPTSPITGGG